MNTDFLNILENLGVLSFVISGIRHASLKRFDWFGAYVVGFITAIGGGTVRDLLLRVTPFWMTDYSYLILTLIGLVGVLLFGRHVEKVPKTLFLFDAIGLGLFVVVGIEKTLANEFPFWVAIIMGTITGSVGGILRDILLNQTPLIFRKDFYAMACIIGGLVYYICFRIGISSEAINLIVAGTIILIRIVAVKYRIKVPNLKPHTQTDRL